MRFISHTPAEMRSAPAGYGLEAQPGVSVADPQSDTSVELVVFAVGLLLIPVAGGYQESRWEILFLVGGPLLVLAGVVGGVRGKRIQN